ncbi:hypothetical protein [uncultured Arcticibacterium sp.]|uniref:hypothetical protein n=1 Tax=uncultured Arcticibacterium sp. TaxID=2173042 RepID=UPI0030FAAC46
MKYLFLFLLLSTSTVFAQLEKNVQVEVLGRPTWQMLIPLEEQGLILIIKTDVTKAAVFRFDKNLDKLWEREVFLDAEDEPKAYTVANDRISLLFSETSGMYYQVFQFNLSSGEVNQDGFELREYFLDQDYVFLNDKVLMAGANAKGAAFFEHNFNTEIGELKADSTILGSVSVNLFEYLPEKSQIESLWSVKQKGYSNEKKKKGEFIKDAFVTHAILDTTGTVLFKTEIKQKGGKFPLDGKLVRLSNGKKVVLGTYQSNIGDKGIYVYNLSGGGDMKTYSFTSLLKGNRSLSVENIQEILKSYNFLSNKPLEGNGNIIFGGVFLKAQYQSITEQDPYNPYNSPYGGGYGRSRYGSRYGYYNQRGNSTTRQVFRGYHYPTGFVMELTPDGDLITSNRIDINNLSGQVQQALAYNERGAVSYCLKGDLAANNFNIGTKPLLYKLSDEEKGVKNMPYLPSYSEVQFWYGNYFIAEGSKSKMEAMSVNDNLVKSNTKKKRGLFGKKRKDTPASFTQIRKTIYLTKIASGG